MMMKYCDDILISSRPLWPVHVAFRTFVPLFQLPFCALLILFPIFFSLSPLSSSFLFVVSSAFFMVGSVFSFSLVPFGLPELLSNGHSFVVLFLRSSPNSSFWYQNLFDIVIYLISDSTFYHSTADSTWDFHISKPDDGLYMHSRHTALYKMELLVLLRWPSVTWIVHQIKIVVICSQKGEIRTTLYYYKHVCILYCTMDFIYPQHVDVICRKPLRSNRRPFFLVFHFYCV